MVIDYLPIVTTLVLLLVGFVSFLIRGWIRFVNENIGDIWQRIDRERELREARWDILHRSCTTHEGRISKLEGRMNNR